MGEQAEAFVGRVKDELIALLGAEIERYPGSHSEIARRTGVTRQTISHILKGRRMPSVDLLAALGHALGFRLALVRVGEEAAPASPAAQVAAIARRLSPRDLEILLAQAKLMAKLADHDGPAAGVLDAESRYLGILLGREDDDTDLP